MKQQGYEVIVDPVYGYRRLEPVPKDDELSEFYESQYYDLVRRGGRAPDLRRLVGGGEEGERERAWLRGTLYADIGDALRRHATGVRVLDVGCGTGEFVAFLNEHGFDAVGIEPSPDAVAHACAQGRPVQQATLEHLAEDPTASGVPAFHAVTMLNVLEHVPHPAQMIEAAKRVLTPDGILCVMVPNDFSEIQLAAQSHLQQSAWWVAVPDHINYFTISSLQRFVAHFGFEVVHTQADFPMELFLLMGDDYVRRPDAGPICHQKRVRLELALPSELRRRLYQALGEIGVGRCGLVFGKLVATQGS